MELIAQVNEAGTGVKWESPARFRALLEKHAGKRIAVAIRKPRAKRSLDQNAYWWAVPVKVLADHCGYTDNQMHYALLGECFGYVAGPTAVVVPVKSSSSELSVEEFTKLIDWVLVWAPSELGCVLQSLAEWQAEV